MRVRSCYKIEAGLRMGPDGITACCCGAQSSPLYWTTEELKSLAITKGMIIKKRKELFWELNSPDSDVCCKKCPMACEKDMEDVSFDKIGFVNVGHYTYCNLRCDYCSYTQNNLFKPPLYDGFSILKLFSKEDAAAENCWCDFNGGEPTLLPDLDEWLQWFKDVGMGVSFFTNAVKFSQKLADGIADKSIMTTIVSLDAGTKETFLSLKKRDKFSDVIENLKRYVNAGAKKYGKTYVKYIFHDLNCGDKDIIGFVEAMKFVRPFEIWLNVDFFPLSELYPGQGKAGEYDFEKHIEAYAKMFKLLVAEGLPAIHYIRDRSSGAYLPQLKYIQDEVIKRIG